MTHGFPSEPVLPAGGIARPAMRRTKTPVLSIATGVTRSCTNQSANRNKSLVIVPKVRVARPVGVRIQATTVRLCTSHPQHRSDTTRIHCLPSRKLGWRAAPSERISPACSRSPGATSRGASRPPAQFSSRAPRTKIARAAAPTGTPIFMLRGASANWHGGFQSRAGSPGAGPGPSPGMCEFHNPLTTTGLHVTS